MCSIMAGPTPGSGPAAIIIPSCRSRCRSRRCPAAGCWRRSRASRPALIAAAERLVEANGLSSAHATFIAAGAGRPVRAGRLADPRRQPVPLAERGYRELRRFPRHSLLAPAQGDPQGARARRVEGLEIVHLTGAAITEAHWDAFWAFYQDTGARKWGHPYLTRAFFSLLGERHGGPAAADPRAPGRAADRRRAQRDRRRRALRPLLGRAGGGALPPFRALLLSGDRRRHRPRPRPRRGGRAGPAQARAAAIARCRPSPPISSPIPASAAPSPISSSASARRWRTRSRRWTR